MLNKYLPGDWMKAFLPPEEPSDFEILLRKSSPPQRMQSIFLLPVGGGLHLQRRLPGASNLRIHWLLHCRQVLYHLSHWILISVRTQLRSGDKLLLLFSHSVMSDSLQPHGLQHTRPPCPSPTPGACSSSCPLSQWCHPTISSSVVPFSSCPRSFPASGSFPMSYLSLSGGQSIGASASVLPISFRIDWG